MRKLADLEHDKFGLKAIFHSIMGIVILILSSVLGMLIRDLFYFITKIEYPAMYIVMHGVLNIVIGTTLICLYISKILKLPLRDFRIARPKSIVIWIICGVLLPVLVSCYFLFFVDGSFSNNNPLPIETMEFILESIFLICLTAGITEELVFRGLMMHLLEKRWGIKIAVIVPSFVFGLLHIFNMSNYNILDVLLLAVAGTAVGIMFSLIAYQSESIWASAIVHGIWNLIIIGSIINIDIKPFEAIYTYTLKSSSMLLTGGEFGIEASLPAVIGYLTIIALAGWLIYRGRKRKLQVS